jgi:uncharacterized protein (TIGR02594 family)
MPIEASPITPSFEKLPPQAAHLRGMMLPPWLAAATRELGQTEIAGAKSNPRILEYRTIAHLPLGGDDGAVPWCAIFVNAMLALAGVTGSGSAMARSFAGQPQKFEKLAQPIVGCITVISSNRGPASGHVFLYTAENGILFQALGGNQNDSVNFSMFQKAKLVGHYWPKGQPKPPAPYDKPVRLARPLLPHERQAARDA